MEIFTLEQFHELSIEKKCSLVTFNGIFLASRNLGGRNAFLFYLQGLFIEIWFSEKGIINNVLAFNEIKGLDLYTEVINIDDLKEVIN